MKRFDGTLTTDGRQLPVTVTLGPAALLIDRASGETLGSWAINGLEVEPATAGTTTMALRHQDHPNVRLQVDDQDFFAQLKEHDPRLRLVLQGSVRRRRRTLLLLGTLLLTAILVLVSIPYLLVPLASRVSGPALQRYGEAVIYSIAGSDGLCRDQYALALVNDLAQRLASPLDLPTPIQVHISNSDEMNAHAVPGGHIIIHRGLLAFVNDAEEFAAVLAHELIHIDEQHPLLGLLEEAGYAMLLSIFVDDTGWLGDATEFSSQVLQMAHSRDMELVADRRALQLLNEVDIRGDGITRFLEHLSSWEEEDGDYADWLDTHPLTSERLIMLSDRQASGGQPPLSEAEWDYLQHACFPPRPSKIEK